MGTLTGCGGAGSESNASDQAGADSSKTESIQSVSSDGFTSMEKVMGFLSEACMEEHGDIKVTYNPTGSGSGIQAEGLA